MKILRVNKQPIESLEKNFKAEYGMNIIDISPTPLSAITALKISKAIDKHDIDVIEVFRQEDAVAAISAKKIAKNKKVRVVFIVGPNYDCPRNLHNEIRQNVDGWIFSSQRLKNLFPKEIRTSIISPPTSYEQINIEATKEKPEKTTIAWIGEIKNTERLKKTLDIIDDIEGDVLIRISGQGKARDVMPAVRYSRGLKHQERIVWLGEEFDTDKEISQCDVAVKTDNDLTETEARILLCGKPVIDIDQIASYIKAPFSTELPSEIKPKNNTLAIRTYYMNLATK